MLGRSSYRIGVCVGTSHAGDLTEAPPRSSGVVTIDLQELCRQNYDRIWRLLRALGVPPNRIDDAAQQVFLVYAERHQDVAQGSESSFLYGTALRVAHNERHARYREIPGEVETAVMPDLPCVDDLSDQKRARELLDRLLEEMEADLRVVFLLYEMEEFTVPEIARIVDVPLGTAASRLRRAREQFGILVKRSAGVRKSNAPKPTTSTTASEPAGSPPDLVRSHRAPARSAT